MIRARADHGARDRALKDGLLRSAAPLQLTAMNYPPQLPLLTLADAGAPCLGAPILLFAVDCTEQGRNYLEFCKGGARWSIWEKLEAALI